MIGFCVSGVGAGALCVATGVVKTPGWVFEQDQAKPHKPPKPRVREADRRQARLDPSMRFAEAVATATPTPTPTRASALRRERTRSQAPTGQRRPLPGHGAQSQESAPISPTPVGSTSEFSPEQQAPQVRSDPAYAPATGGGEFTP